MFAPIRLLCGGYVAVLTAFVIVLSAMSTIRRIIMFSLIRLAKVGYLLALSVVVSMLVLSSRAPAQNFRGFVVPGIPGGSVSGSSSGGSISGSFGGSSGSFAGGSSSSSASFPGIPGYSVSLMPGPMFNLPLNNFLTDTTGSPLAAVGMGGGGVGIGGGLGGGLGGRLGGGLGGLGGSFGGFAGKGFGGFNGGKAL